MNRRFHPVLVCAAWAAATAAVAQTAPTKVALSSGDVGKQAFDFVQAYQAAAPKIDQIPRWQDPLCVQVIGLPDAQAAQVKGRIEEVAKDVGLSAAPAGCNANVQIAFTPQPQKLVDNFVKGREWVLGYYYKDPGVKTVTRPIQGWYVTATESRAPGANQAFAFAYTGVPSQASGNPTQTANKVLDSPTSWSPTGCGDSTFTSCLRSELVNVFVVVDTVKAQGKSVGVLSDYLAMVVLSQPRALGAACQPLPSVTDLFVDGCPGGPPGGVTPADAAYLTAL